MDVPSADGCSVSPFFPRCLILFLRALPDLGQRKTHFPSEERKNDATPIDQNRMTPREKSSLDGNRTRSRKMFLFSLSLSLSLPTPYAPPTRHIPPRGLPCVARVKWFFAGLVPAAIFSRSAALPYRTKLVKLVSLTRGFDIWGET